MGWGDCGTDSNGRPIGYVFEAICDFPGCDNRIDRGLSYACGAMHGQNEFDCEGYFCGEHLHFPNDPENILEWRQPMCKKCNEKFEEYKEGEKWVR